MRTPLGIGLVVGAAILLTLIALVHLVFNPRRTGRWLWLVVIVALPVLGPLLYFIAGRRADPEDWDDLEAYRAEHAPLPPAKPLPPTVPAAVPAAEPSPTDVYRDDIEAPVLAPFAHAHPSVEGVPVEELAYDDETTADYTVRDDGSDLPDFAVRDASEPLTDDVPQADAYGALETPTADEAAVLADEGDVEVPETVRIVEVEDPVEAAPFSDPVEAAPPAKPAPETPDVSEAEPRRDHLRARRRKPR